MAAHYSLEALGVTHIQDMGALGNDPPPMDLFKDFGLSPIPKSASTLDPAQSLRFGA